MQDMGRRSAGCDRPVGHEREARDVTKGTMARCYERASAPTRGLCAGTDPLTPGTPRRLHDWREMEVLESRLSSEVASSRSIQRPITSTT